MRYSIHSCRNSISCWVRAPERQAWLFALLVCCSVFSITGWRVLRAYDLQLSEGQITTANLARSLADHAHATVQAADIVLAGLVERLQAEGTSDVALARLHRLLIERVAAVQEIHHLVVFSATGDALTTSFDPMPPVNVVDRTYFIFHRDHPAFGSLVGPPVRNRADGHWSLTLSRRFDEADGTFGGVVVAVIDCDTFARFYASFNVGAHGSIVLLNDTNVIIVRHPLPPNPDFRDIPRAQDRWHQGPAGNGRIISSLDGVARVYSYQRADRTSLMVIVALSEDDLLAVWWRDAWITLAACLAVLAVLSLLGWRLAQQIRQREQREIIVRRSEAQYRLLADYSTDVIIHLGLDCRQQYVSPASERLLGYRPEELVDRHLCETIHPEDWLVMEKNIAEILCFGNAPPVGFRMGSKDGLYVWVEALGQKLDSSQGLIVTLRDVTLRKQAEELLRSSNNCLSSSNTELERLARHLAKSRDAAELASQAKSRFLAGMSHELRTPLNGILGYAHLLRIEHGLNPIQAGRVDAMLGAGSHLLQMINRVLNLSEVEAGHAQLQMSEINSREVARACLDLVRPTAQAKGLTLDFDAALGVPQRVTTDPTRLRQILLNLLGNAVKFTARGAVELRLLTALDGARLRFEVADTGPGVLAEHRERLFQAFERLDAKVDGAIEGAGLGLALSAKLASMMGGGLGHEDNVGGGSVFWLDLPIVIGADESFLAVASSPDMHGAAPVPTPSMRILVVDDLAMNREIAGAFLRAAGHKVIYAENGTTAVATAASGDFDVVLMDVRMPGMDGLEATRRIRALAGPRARVPVVALTAQAFKEQIEECLRAGMNSHLAKPFTPRALLDAAKHALEAGKAQRRVNVPPFETMGGNGDFASASTVSPAVDLELPVFDVDAFERTAAFLAPEAVTAYLQTIVGRGRALLGELRAPGALEQARASLADAAHSLSGSAGMFGFRCLANAACRFENAVRTAGPEVPALASSLGAAIEASLEELQDRKCVAARSDLRRHAPSSAISGTD